MFFGVRLRIWLRVKTHIFIIVSIPIVIEMYHLFLRQMSVILRPLVFVSLLLLFGLPVSFINLPLLRYYRQLVHIRILKHIVQPLGRCQTMNFVQIKSFRSQLQLNFFKLLSQFQSFICIVDILLEVIQLLHHILLENKQFTYPVLLLSHLLLYQLIPRHLHHQRRNCAVDIRCCRCCYTRKGLVFGIGSYWVVFGMIEGTLIVVASPLYDFGSLVYSPF